MGRATVAFKALNELVSCQWKSCAPLKKVRRGWRVGEAVHTPSGLYIWTNRASAVVQSNSRQNKIEARGQTSNTISRDSVLYRSDIAGQDREATRRDIHVT